MRIDQFSKEGGQLNLAISSRYWRESNFSHDFRTGVKVKF